MLIHIHISINTYWQKHKTGVTQQRGEEGKGRRTKRELWEAKRCREKEEKEGRMGKKFVKLCTRERNVWLSSEKRRRSKEKRKQRLIGSERRRKRRRRRRVRLGMEMEIWAMCLPCSQKHKSTWDNVFESHILRTRPKYTESVRLFSAVGEIL